MVFQIEADLKMMRQPLQKPYNAATHPKLAGNQERVLLYWYAVFATTGLTAQRLAGEIGTAKSIETLAELLARVISCCAETTQYLDRIDVFLFGLRLLAEAKHTRHIQKLERDIARRGGKRRLLTKVQNTTKGV